MGILALSGQLRGSTALGQADAPPNEAGGREHLPIEGSELLGDGPALIDNSGRTCDCPACTGKSVFDQWQPLEAENLGTDGAPMHFSEPLCQPVHSLHDWCFRHSSTHGRHVGHGIPLERSSWLNRPYHIDWYLGPLLGDDLARNRVGQSNVVFGGVRVGWDFDYYWGVQWRFGWAAPNLQTSDTIGNPNKGRYFISDVDLIYYPWGDTKIRPYFLLGLGLNEVGSVNPDGTGHEATVAVMPFGMGVDFPQTSWLAWRLEVLDNFSFSGDGISSMHNISLTAGMEFRLGARPRSYWPWRSSRKFW